MSVRSTITGFGNRIKAAAEAFRVGHSLLFYPHEADRGRWQPNDYKAQVEAYRDIVYACVRMIAVTGAKVKLRLYRTMKGNDEEISDHRFLDLMREVNPFMNEFELKYLTLVYGETTGNIYWLLNADRLGIPAEIWVQQSQYMKIVPDAQQFIRSYIFEKSGQVIRYEPEQIIHFKYPNPNDPWYGESPVRAADYAIDANEYINRYHSGLFKNFGMPGTIINVEGQLGKDEVARLESQYQAKFGGFEKAGKPAIIAGKKTTIQKVAMTPAELDYIASQNMIMDRICGIFGVPSLMLSKTERVNRANMESAYTMFLRDTVVPKLKLIEEKLNEKLIPRYKEKGLYCEFDNPIPEDETEKRAWEEMHLQNYVLRVNEVREQMGLDPVPWGDSPLVPFGVGPLGSAPPEVGLPPKSKLITKQSNLFAVLTEQEKDAKRNQFLARITPQENAMARDLRRYFRRQRDIVLGNIEKMKSYSVKDPTDYILFALDSENELLTLLANPHWQEAMMAGALYKIGALGLSIDWDMTNPRVVAWLANKEMLIKEVNVATREALRQVILDGYREGLGVPEIAKRIKEQYDSFEQYRALRIARTEVVGSQNWGGHQVLEEAEIEKHAWLTAHAEMTRDSHLNAEAEGWIPLHQPFISTDPPMMHPHDPNGSAGEVINCRCTELP